MSGFTDLTFTYWRDLSGFTTASFQAPCSSLASSGMQVMAGPSGEQSRRACQVRCWIGLVILDLKLKPSYQRRGDAPRIVQLAMRKLTPFKRCRVLLLRTESFKRSEIPQDDTAREISTHGLKVVPVCLSAQAQVADKASNA